MDLRVSVHGSPDGKRPAFALLLAPTGEVELVTEAGVPDGVNVWLVEQVAEWLAHQPDLKFDDAGVRALIDVAAGKLEDKVRLGALRRSPINPALWDYIQLTTEESL